MDQHNTDVIRDAWDCVLRARSADAVEQRALALRLTDLIEQERDCSSMLRHRAVIERQGASLRLLADAAPPDRCGPLHRLSAVVDEEIDELDDYFWDEPEDEDDELPP